MPVFSYRRRLPEGEGLAKVKGVGLAALDVRGDGRNELVRLWPLCGGEDPAPVITMVLERGRLTASGFTTGAYRRNG
jgi:hypothetical protein